MSDVFVKIGDVVHVETADAGLDVAPAVLAAVPAPSVANLLDSARAAHARFQAATGHNDGQVIRQPDDAAALAAVTEAHDARLAALALDPERRDSAWADDAALMRVPSATLEAFYADYVAPDVPL